MCPAPTKDLSAFAIDYSTPKKRGAPSAPHLDQLCETVSYFDGAGAAGALTFTFTFVELLPPNSRPLKTYAAAKITITKITSTATTPALPPPSPLSPINYSFFVCRGIGEIDQRGMARLLTHTQTSVNHANSFEVLKVAVAPESNRLARRVRM